MVARRRAASSNRDQQPRPARAKSPEPCVSRLGEKGGAHCRFSNRSSRAWKKLPEMQDSFSELLAGSFGAGKASAGRAASDQREHAAKGIGSAVIMNRKQTLSIMINEEDHLRMQAIRSGLQLKSVFKTGRQSGQQRSRQSSISRFDRQLGYLTACPTNVGTGMRASAMVHLPGLGPERADQSGDPGGEQNRSRRPRTLWRRHGGDGQSISDLEPDDARRKGGRNHPAAQKVIEQIIEKEHDARQMLIQKKPNTALGPDRPGLSACLPMPMP